ncbi:uncharacterized protein LOC108201698 [Daucus carota subsp. sativus]|uniref:uncharacterized protein LOC108201698 n=1 Tax=Daucus carota subsp. sativus TaxID=79200 RepID=UPI0007EFDD03|nr:PREDICTED: C-Myc-binding protein-like [Daucus carota subsp. sativus]
MGHFSLEVLIAFQVKSTCPISEKEAKKEAFRKYLESRGVADSLTKVLVALYEPNVEPSSAIEIIQQRMGGLSLSDYDKLLADMSVLRIKHKELLAAHEVKRREIEELLSSIIMSSAKETNDMEGSGA